MSKIEDRLRGLVIRWAQRWNPATRTERSAQLRREAKARAQQAATRVQDFRDSERGQRAASKISDLRTSETAKKAEAAWGDLRASETGRKAESALADLRQRESVKKAEESARKAMHDLFSGTGGTGS